MLERKIAIAARWAVSDKRLHGGLKAQDHNVRSVGESGAGPLHEGNHGRVAPAVGMGEGGGQLTGGEDRRGMERRGVAEHDGGETDPSDALEARKGW